jgi:protein arginine kinase activator
MLCDVCKKREATIHIKEVKDGKCISTNVCPECAREKELASGLGAFGFNLAEVIFNVGKTPGNKKKTESFVPKTTQRVICPHCKWTLVKMRDSGKVGCPECYSVFAEWMDEFLESSPKGKIHMGKRPRACTKSLVALKLEIDRLQLDLARVVSAEDYEKAAQYRDRINALKAEMESLQSGEEK